MISLKGEMGIKTVFDHRKRRGWCEGNDKGEFKDSILKEEFDFKELR